MRSISKKVALLCLLLTIWSAAALAAHHHSNATDAAKCTVCVAAHSASPKAVSTLPKATFGSGAGRVRYSCLKEAAGEEATYANSMVLPL
jgi:hypothetical protein